MPADPAIAAIIEFRSGDLLRIRNALRDPPRDPLIIGALVQLLARDDVLRSVTPALATFGARAAGEMVSVLLDPTTPDVLRRRLPLALKSCPSTIARDGLQTALERFGFEIRLRCGRALLALTDEYPELQESFPNGLALVDRELNGGGEPPLVREHVFNLLALTRIASRCGSPPAPSPPKTPTYGAPLSSTSRLCCQRAYSSPSGRCWPRQSGRPFPASGSGRAGGPDSGGRDHDGQP